jgi:uncharacterized protein (TIGR00369 family)
MGEITPVTDHTIAEHLSQVPHAAALGMRLVGYEDGKALVRVPYAEHLVGDPDTGVIHGGVLTAVLDNASGMAVPRASLSEAQRAIATLDLRIDYMRPAKPREDLLVEAECYQLTRAIAFVRARAYQASDDRTIASSVATFMLGANRATPPGFEAASDPSGSASGAEGER